jgi:superfamily I DNA/RNA helicase
MTFDSILEYGLLIIEGDITVPWKWLFVDEAQDSSNLDFEIYMQLPIQNKMLIGDEDQRVFSFRGASDSFQKLCNQALQSPE